MRRVDREIAHKILTRRQSAGNHIDSRLLREIDNQGDLYLLQLEDEDSFLSLIWQESDHMRLLTPAGESRTLRDVGMRLIGEGYTFEKLSENLDLPRNQHQPEWFTKCIPIER